LGQIQGRVEADVERGEGRGEGCVESDRQDRIARREALIPPYPY